MENPLKHLHRYRTILRDLTRKCQTGIRVRYFLNMYNIYIYMLDADVIKVNAITLVVSQGTIFLVIYSIV